MVFFSVSSKVLGPIFTKLRGKVEGGPDISLRGSFFERSRSSRSKVKFMGFFCLKLGECIQVDPLIKTYGSNWVKGHRVSRSKVKFMGFFSVCSPYFSQVLGPIFTKLGGKVEGGPGY